MESILHKPLPLLLASFQHYVPWKKWSNKLLYYSLVLIKFMGYTLLYLQDLDKPNSSQLKIIIFTSAKKLCQEPTKPQE